MNCSPLSSNRSITAHMKSLSIRIVCFALLGCRKRFLKYSILCAAAALSLSACTKDIITPDQSMLPQASELDVDITVDQETNYVTFTLNTGDVPELRVSQSFVDTMRQYREDSGSMSRQMKEALLYTKKKVEAAQGFIEAIKVRRRTLTMTMQAIINWQHRFFEDGDEASLRPMILKDIAEKTGLDISTVSRVTGSKYAQTRWGTFPLRHFFSDSLVTESGEELSTRRIKAALRDIVEAEDTQRPLSDDALKDALAAQGFPIARRTVAKYREQLGIPIARLRR